jgi:hypothetical protein
MQQNASFLVGIVADDLTSVLASAAELAGLCGPVPLRWTDDVGVAAIRRLLDNNPREMSDEQILTIYRAAL